MAMGHVSATAVLREQRVNCVEIPRFLACLATKVSILRSKTGVFISVKRAMLRKTGENANK